jgi:hypothetical protein
MADGLTKPEHETERALAKRIRDRMTNVCDHCIHRQVDWGYSHCPRDGRSFPTCVETPGISFELDERTIRG